MKTKMNIKPEVLKIRKGLFFPEDFSKLPEGTFIYISKGILINIEEGKETEETKTEEETETKQKVKHKHKHKNGNILREKGKNMGGQVRSQKSLLIKRDLKKTIKKLKKKLKKKQKLKKPLL